MREALPITGLSFSYKHSVPRAMRRMSRKRRPLLIGIDQSSRHSFVGRQMISSGPQVLEPCSATWLRFQQRLQKEPWGIIDFKPSWISE